MLLSTIPTPQTQTGRFSQPDIHRCETALRSLAAN